MVASKKNGISQELSTKKAILQTLRAEGFVVAPKKRAIKKGHLRHGEVKIYHGYTIKKDGKLKGYLFSQREMFDYWIPGLNWRTLADTGMNDMRPDFAIYWIEERSLRVIESKRQDGQGTAYEKLGAGPFRLRQIMNRAKIAGITDVKLSYYCNDWLYSKLESYDNGYILEYLIGEGITCHTGHIPFEVIMPL